MNPTNASNDLPESAAVGGGLLLTPGENAAYKAQALEERIEKLETLVTVMAENQAKMATLVGRLTKIIVANDLKEHTE